MLLPIRPAELGKTTNTTFTTSYNLLCVAILLQGKQQNTTFLVNHELKQSLLKLCHGAKKCHKMEHLRLECASLLSWRSVVHSCFPCRNPWSAWASKRRLSPRSVVSCCKSCSSCFLCVHVESHHFREEPQFFLSLLGQATTTGCGDRSLSLRRGSRSESLPYCADRHRHTFLYRFPSHLFS